jgi:hypothetical protein
MYDPKEIKYIQNQLRKKRFENSKELQEFIIGFEYDEMIRVERKKSVGFVPKREPYVPVIPQYER